MRLSFSSRASCKEVFDWAYHLEDIGYEGWEIVHEGEQELTPENIRIVKDIADTTNLGISLHLPFSDMNLAGLNKNLHHEVLRQMKLALENAAGIAELAVVHPGYLSPYGAQVPEKARIACVQSLKELAETGEEYGILIAVENMPEFPMVFGRTPEDMRSLIEEAGNENLKMTLDIGHANTTRLVDEFLDNCKDIIAHCHIHDNKGKHDEHLPVGEGDIDWKTVLGKLADFDGFMVTEMKDLGEGRKCVDFLKSIQ
ncbi:sugar phosphate isomerase/epimerase [Methanohalophilus levihalophilus]|uniref:sugar phosphate isomerase/epimerase family protein n=1 Tax=Methanohalophilus levihalophilus TaxID=1431282 RepID=UPI001AE663D3|nr:sugar phosphate isomerase/epimerase family protein [Methanohalophilus levihalophilus]MBP2030218.1 sugar phosphate isomerase/epimerase [Methanohalophilus levihalophilus]